MSISKYLCSLILVGLVVSPVFAQKEGKDGAKVQGSQKKQTEQKFDDKAMIDLATKKGCMACHQMDAKLIGPAWKEVSQKYTENDVSSLVNSVLNGSVGKWGNVPMTANKGIVTEQEAEQLVRWIITLKNKK